MKTLTGLLILVFCASAQADYFQGANLLTADLGWVVPVNHLDLNTPGTTAITPGRPGPGFGAQYLHYTGPRVAVGVDVMVPSLEDRSSPTLIPNTDSQVHTSSVIALALAKYNFLAQDPVSPYTFLGFGLHRTSLNVVSTPINGFGWPDTGTAEPRTLIDGSGLSYAFATGLGLDIPLTNNSGEGQWIFGMEGRYIYLGGVAYSATAAGRSAFGLSDVRQPGSLLMGLARVGYNFY